MASLPSDENPELAPGQQPINRGNINREIIDGELVDYGDSADEEEPAAQVAAAEGRQRQNAGQEAQRPAWARDFMQEVQTAIAGNTQRLNALMKEVRTPGTRPGAWRTARMQELHPAGETFEHHPAEEIFEPRRINLPLDRPTQRSRQRVPSRIVRISHSPPPPEATHHRGSRSSKKLHWKPPRPETFSGDSKQDLNTWLGTVELYAYNAEVADEEKAEMAAGYLTGNAARAFLNACSAANTRCITDWETFCDVLRSDFGQIFESHQARNKLEKLSQTGRADGYIRAFKNLINQMADDPMAQSDQVRFFYKGLKPHLQRDCKSDPSTGGPFKSLDKIMNHALSLEMSGDPKEGKDPTSDNKKRKNDSDDKSNKKGKSNSGRSKSTFYQEGSDELAYARENNLCLHCAKSGHITKECRHKKAGRPATPIVVPTDWIRKGDANRG
ncbi:hypothetical protein CVIRNUC_000207 [Coccomyxa viridis]|uniref:CCHC-type domain-containing protein n=1 Tax=Coccomyxa viridis TaxID=1274662 RepID=A0AAV1HU50_9CHLO|nr:hypothetical protein CVIRNUC_000207 [Coccomyxa viridis]